MQEEAHDETESQNISGARLAFSQQSTLLGTNWGSIRAILIPSEGSAPNPLTTHHSLFHHLSTLPHWGKPPAHKPLWDTLKPHPKHSAHLDDEAGEAATPRGCGREHRCGKTVGFWPGMLSGWCCYPYGNYTNIVIIKQTSRSVLIQNYRILILGWYGKGVEGDRWSRTTNSSILRLGSQHTVCTGYIKKKKKRQIYRV